MNKDKYCRNIFRQRLKDLRIKLDVYVSPGTHHEWLTWRRCFKEFVPHLFK